jgi:hypothetical protein
MGFAARKLILCMLAGFYLLGLSGIAATGSSCCCKKAGGPATLINYCCLKTAAAPCDGLPGISACHATEAAKEFTGPLAALSAMPRTAPAVRPALPHIQTDPLASEGFTALPERPPTLA